MMKKFDWVRDLIIFLLSISALLVNAGRWVGTRENSEAALLQEIRALQASINEHVKQNTAMHERIDAQYVSKENLELRLKNIELKIDNLAARTR